MAYNQLNLATLELLAQSVNGGPFIGGTNHSVLSLGQAYQPNQQGNAGKRSAVGNPAAEAQGQVAKKVKAEPEPAPSRGTSQQAPQQRASPALAGQFQLQQQQPTAAMNSAAAGRPMQTGSPSIKDMIQLGLFKSDRLNVQMACGGQVFKAGLNSEGHIVYDGRPFATPTTFATAVKRLFDAEAPQDDGMQSLYIEGIPLGEWRNKYLAVMGRGGAMAKSEAMGAGGGGAAGGSGPKPGSIVAGMAAMGGGNGGGSGGGAMGAAASSVPSIQQLAVMMNLDPSKVTQQQVLQLYQYQQQLAQQQQAQQQQAQLLLQAKQAQLLQAQQQAQLLQAQQQKQLAAQQQQQHAGRHQQAPVAAATSKQQQAAKNKKKKKKKRGDDSDESEEEEEPETDQWVQCSRCNAWRIVPDDFWDDIRDGGDEPWYCKDALWDVTDYEPHTAPCQQ